MRTRHLIFFVVAWLFQIQFAFSQTNKLYITPTDCPLGTTSNVAIQLDNSSEIVALQFNLHVPDVVKLANSGMRLLDARSDGHTITVKDKGENNYLVIVMSFSNKFFKGRSGALIELPLEVPDDLEAGKSFPFEMTDVILSDRNGKNVMTSFDAGSIRIVDGNGPDITVSSIQLISDNFTPGGKVSIAWTVQNVGGRATEAGWNEQLYLVDELGNEYFLGRLSCEEILSASGTISRQAEFNLSDYPGVEGTVKAKVVLTPFADLGELPVDAENNEVTSAASLNMPKILTWRINASSIQEENTQEIFCFLNRSGSRLDEETFTLTQSATGRLELPASVTIPKGESGVSFSMKTINDDVANRDSFVVVAVSGNSYPNLEQKIWIEDDETPALTVTAPETVQQEGNSFNLTIARPWTTEWPLEVRLSTDHPKRFTFASKVIIPKNAASVEVPVQVLEDDIPDVNVITAVFKASHTGYETGVGFVEVEDDDVPDIDLEITPTTLPEGGGPQAAIATLRRSGVTGNKITIKLTDTSDGLLYYPSSSITLDSGETEYQFAIGISDNDQQEGDREVTLNASVYISTCDCSTAGTNVGTVTKKITITDNDGPTLTLSSSQTSLIEGKEQATILTVTRNTSTAEALTVNISCDRPEEVTYASTVTIPSGESSVDIPVAVKKNDITEGNRTISFAATADGYSSGTCWAMITDQTLPDAELSNFKTQKTSFFAREEIDVEILLENKGIVSLPASTKISVYLSPWSQIGTSSEQVLLGNIYTESEIPANGIETLKRTFVLPDKTGTYYIMAIADEDQNLQEIIKTNNTTNPVKIQLEPLYKVAQISTDKTSYKPGETIIITGQVTGGIIANMPIDLYVRCDGYQQLFDITTDEQGVFQYSYTPEDWMMGHIDIGACYPDEGLMTEMAVVNIYGLKKGDVQPIRSEVLLNQSSTGKIKLYNPSELSLTNIRGEIISLPENCTITFSPLASLSGNSTGVLSYTITGTEVSKNRHWEEIKVRIITDEGPTLDATIYYACRAEKGSLISEQSVIKTTMVKGSSRDYQLRIANTGKGETGKISVNIPNVPWMRLASSSEMASLQFEETATIILRLQPTDDMSLNMPVEGTIGVNCENGTGFLLPFHITPVSESTGTLKIDVCDEYTYNTTEAPHVQGAQVRITTPIGKLIEEGVTGNDGLFIKELPEGYYVVEVTAEKHDVYRNTILVDPGTETSKVVNLSMQGIEISYSVEKIDIEDRYEIVMDLQFETNVPVPVVLTTVNMPQRSTENLLKAGESFMATATLTNKGLITAEDVQLLMPENAEPLVFEPLINEPFDLPAQSSKIIPVKITYSPQSMLRASDENSGSLTEEEGLFKGCSYHWGTVYFWDCGFDKKWHQYYTVVKIYDDCGEPLVSLPSIPLPIFGGVKGDSSLGIPNGWFDTNNNGSVITPSTPVVNQDKNCVPCITGMTVATLKCAGHWVPAAEEMVAAKELWDAFIEALQNLVLDESGANDMINAAYNLLTPQEQEFLEQQMDNLALGEFFAEAAQSVLECGNLSQNYDFESVMSCVSGVTESADNFFDESIDLLFKKLYPNPDAKQAEQLKKVKKLGKKAVDALGKLLNVADCLHDFATACDHLLEQNPEGSKLRAATIPGYLIEFSDRMAIASQEMDAYANIWLSIFGENVVWQECDIYDLANILKELPTDGVVVAENVVDIKPEEVPMAEWKWFVDRWNNTISGNLSGNCIDMNRIFALQQTMSDMNEQVLSWGYKSLSECITKEVEIIQEKIEGGSNSVCSSISLQFSQTMTMTRQAFRGTLTVYNGHETLPMEDVRLNLEVKDVDGNIATSREFQINTEKLDTFTGDLDGGWNLDAQKTGTVTILFIPSKYAAPTEEKLYSFGGTLSYVDPFTGLEVVRDLFPVTLAVSPSPNLKLTYFMQRDILGDDPLTVNKVEPSVPAEFALLIQNTGAGDATNVNMVTNQPEIVDNEKGLAIDFELLSSTLNGEEESLALGGSVTTAFGTIPAGQTSYAQWWFSSSLLGHFTDYEVKATHITSYDNPDLSLLDGDPTIHELIRGIKVVGSDLVGFLVNDLVDAEDMPDMIYLTDGSIEQVKSASGVIKSSGERQYTLTVTPSVQGWIYGSIDDPTGGYQELVGVTRLSDGATIDLRNIWQTSCTLRDGKDPLYENKIHFADKISGPTSYQLTFEPGPSVVLEVASFEGMPSDNEVADKPVTEVTVHFNKAIDPTTFTSEDLNLILQGERQDEALIKIERQDDQTFLLDLTEVTKLDGYYVLTVQTAGITDQEGFKGKVGKSVNWTQYLAPGYQTLSMDLSEGWNWISTNMEGVSDPMTLLFPIQTQVLRMQNQTQEVTNDPELGLVGNLTDVVPETFYKLEMASDGKMDITGTVLTPNQVEIDLRSGWNWIGYIPRSAASPAKALALLSASVGDEVKGQDGFAQYNGSTWIGTLDKMEPGKGYMYRAGKSQTFQYPLISPLEVNSSLRSAELRVAANSPWAVDIHKYPNNMSMIADLWENGQKAQADEFTVGAFCGDECRGVGQYVEGRLFMTIYGGKVGEKISFRAIRNGQSSEWGILETVSFGESTQGSLDQPFVLTLGNQLTGLEILDRQNGIYPNPVKRILYIKGQIDDIRRVRVIGLNGSVRMSQSLNGGNSLDVSSLGAGLYILVIERDQKVEFHKFIKE